MKIPRIIKAYKANNAKTVPVNIFGMYNIPSVLITTSQSFALKDCTPIKSKVSYLMVSI